MRETAPKLQTSKAPARVGLLDNELLSLEKASSQEASRRLGFWEKP